MRLIKVLEGRVQDDLTEFLKADGNAKPRVAEILQVKPAGVKNKLNNRLGDITFGQLNDISRLLESDVANFIIFVEDKLT